MNKYEYLGKQIDSLRDDYLKAVIIDSDINNLEKIQIITDNLLFGNNSIKSYLSHPLNIFEPELQKLVEEYCKKHNETYICRINDDLLIDRENLGRGTTVLYRDVLFGILENLEYDNEELDIDWDKIETYQLYHNTKVMNLEIPVLRNRGDGDVELTKSIKVIIDTIYNYMIDNSEIGFKFDW